MAFQKCERWSRGEYVTVTFQKDRRCEGAARAMLHLSAPIARRVFGDIRRADVYADADAMQLGVAANAEGMFSAKAGEDRVAVPITVAMRDVRFDERRLVNTLFRPPFQVKDVDGVEMLVVDLKERHDAAYEEDPTGG